MSRFLICLQILLMTSGVTLSATDARAAQGGPPPSEFEDTHWLYCETTCDDVVYFHRIHMRADGSMGYQKTADAEMIYDGTDSWRIVGKYLVLIWTNAYSVEVYEVGTGGQQVYTGLHSLVDVLSVIQRAPESGGTEPDPTARPPGGRSSISDSK